VVTVITVLQNPCHDCILLKNQYVILKVEWFAIVKRFRVKHFGFLGFSGNDGFLMKTDGCVVVFHIGTCRQASPFIVHRQGLTQGIIANRTVSFSATG
jgi:hypothetical protein